MKVGSRDVVITGMGAVTAQGVGVEPTWEGVLKGREVLRAWDGVAEGHPLRKIKVALCGELQRPADLPEWFWEKLSRTQQLACIAMDEALGQAGTTQEMLARAGLFVGTTVCGMDQNERFYAEYREKKDGADAELMRRLQPYEVRSLLARRHGIGGPGWVSLTTCVGSAMAIASACDAIELGECEVAIAGGSEGMCRVVLSGFNALKVTAMEGCRPFDKDRPGMTVGEGAGMVVLESRAHAERRGAKILGRVCGVGITCDAHHLTAPDPAGKEAVRAIEESLSRAGVSAKEIGYVNAHGTGTKDNDAMEAGALVKVFGADGPWVSSTKRATGHTFGAAGVIEAILCVRAMRDRMLPVNAGGVNGEDFGIRVVRGESVREKVGLAVSTNFAFGGNNTAIVLAGELNHEDTKARKGERGGEYRSEGNRVLNVLGIGMMRDEVERFEGAEVIAEEKVAGMDPLAALVIRAGHQAWKMAKVESGEDVGLIVVTGWGAIDATVGYLDSMLEAEGKYASPRHFSRSVYSSAASLAAIHFGIHGPVLTLAFEGDYVRGALAQARRMLLAERCKRVMVVWADQYGAIAEELSKVAVEKLRKAEYARYVERGLGYGGTAVMVSLDEAGLGRVNVDSVTRKDERVAKGFPTDGAAGWIKMWFRERLGVE